MISKYITKSYIIILAIVLISIIAIVIYYLNHNPESVIQLLENEGQISN